MDGLDETIPESIFAKTTWIVPFVVVSIVEEEDGDDDDDDDDDDDEDNDNDKDDGKAFEFKFFASSPTIETKAKWLYE